MLAGPAVFVRQLGFDSGSGTGMGNFYSFLFFSTLYQSIWDPILCTSGNRHVLHPTDTSWVNKFVRKFMLSGPRSFFSIKILMQETLKSNQKHSLDLV